VTVKLSRAFQAADGIELRSVGRTLLSDVPAARAMLGRFLHPR
jgi:hypothetical protein